MPQFSASQGMTEVGDDKANRCVNAADPGICWCG